MNVVHIRIRNSCRKTAIAYAWEVKSHLSASVRNRFSALVYKISPLAALVNLYLEFDLEQSSYSWSLGSTSWYLSLISTRGSQFFSVSPIIISHGRTLCEPRSADISWIFVLHNLMADDLSYQSQAGSFLEKPEKRDPINCQAHAYIIQNENILRRSRSQELCHLLSILDNKQKLLSYPSLSYTWFFSR